MTIANAQTRMASNTGAMTDTPQLPPAANAQPMASTDASRQDAWMRQDPGLPSNRRGLIPGRHRDYALCTGYARHALARIEGSAVNTLCLVLSELQTIRYVQFSVMRQCGAKTCYDTNRRIVFTPSDRFAMKTSRGIGI